MSVAKSLTLEVFYRSWAQAEKGPIVPGVDTVPVYGRSGGCNTADNLSSTFGLRALQTTDNTIGLCP
jgi:hypothetical protein